VCEGVPLRGVLEPQRHRVVGPHVDEAVVALAHVAHEDVEERLRVALHVFGRRQARREATLVQRDAAGIVERQAEAEADPVLDLAHPLEDLLGSDEVHPAELVVVAEVAPGGAIGTLGPSLRHACPLSPRILDRRYSWTDRYGLASREYRRRRSQA
jgi:hypothetical protein